MNKINPPQEQRLHTQMEAVLKMMEVTLRLYKSLDKRLRQIEVLQQKSSVQKKDKNEKIA